MKRIIFSLVISLFLIGMSFTWQKGMIMPKEVSFDDLISNPEKYNNKNVLVEAFYFSGFEFSVLAPSLGWDGAGQFGAVEPYIWFTPKFSKEDFAKLYSEESEHDKTKYYGKVKTKGYFEYGEKYGHMGAYNYRLTASKTEVLENAIIFLTGMLIPGGVECRQFKADDGSIYSLQSNGYMVGGFKDGDRVSIKGELLFASYCQQSGIDLDLLDIKRMERI